MAKEDYKTYLLPLINEIQALLHRHLKVSCNIPIPRTSFTGLELWLC